MSHSPHFARLANGLSSVVVIAAVVACAYTFGKRITTAEASIGQFPGDTISGLAFPNKADSESGSGQVSSKSDSQRSADESKTPGAEPTAKTNPDKPAASNSDGRVLEAVATVNGGVGFAGSMVPAGDADLMEFDATAYSIQGQTAAGIAAHKGTIAADPRILPLGSVVHIRAGDYSGTYLVLDTGAKIKGRKIDIYMPDRREAISFGRRSVRLKVLGRVHPRHLQPK